MSVFIYKTELSSFKNKWKSKKEQIRAQKKSCFKEAKAD